MKNLLCLFLMVTSLIARNALADPTPPSTINAPWVETFTKDGVVVAYAGAVHHSSLHYPDASQDPIFETVSDEFSLLQPQAVIVEGVDPKDLQGFLEFAKQCADANYNLAGQMCDEPEFTAVEAMNAGAVVLTGEPSGSSVASYFESQGYTAQDLLAFYVMRSIPVQNNHVPLTEETFPAFFQSIVRGGEQDLDLNVSFTVADFAVWYAKNMPLPANYLNISTNDTGPTPDTGGAPTVLNKLSATDMVMRDGNVVSTIQQAMSTYQRILVVYGASHPIFEWPQLVQLLGDPVFTKPY
jgi:hypothetical protein